MKAKSATTTIIVVIAVVLTLFTLWISIANDRQAAARSSLTFIAGAATGGGWDTTARSIQEVARGQGIVNNVQVVNIPGAGGTIALEGLAQKAGSENTLLVIGGGMIASSEIARSGVSITDVTPIARMTEEYSVIVVPQDSEFQTLQDFIDAWLADPQSVTIGGAAIGNTDHLLVSRAAMTLGMDPKAMKYIPFEGGGEMLNAMLSDSIDVGVTGYPDIRDQVEAGNLRVLGMSSPERVEGMDFPTFSEQGLDLVATNWRGIAAPPGLEPEERQELIDILTEVNDTEEWKEITDRNNWQRVFLAGDEFEKFVAQEREDALDTVEALGL